MRKMEWQYLISEFIYGDGTLNLININKSVDLKFVEHGFKYSFDSSDILGTDLLESIGCEIALLTGN